MQNRENRFYKIGTTIIEYEGPAFSERDNLKLFRIEKEMPHIKFKLVPEKVIEIPEIPLVWEEEYIHRYETENQKIRIIYNQKKTKVLMKDCCYDGFHHHVEYDVNYMIYWDTNMMMKLFELPIHLLNEGGVFLHASYIIWKDKAILFTAPKQTGKSTQAALWSKYNGAEIINGDRAFIKKEKGLWMAHGSPYCGTSGICKNISAPIGAIVILSQADKNKIRRAKTIEAFITMMEGCTYEKRLKSHICKVTDIVKEIVTDISFYQLACLPDKSAVDILEEVLWKRESTE